MPASPASGAERAARHRRRQQEHVAALERHVAQLEAKLADLEAEHADCLPLLGWAADLRRRAAEIEGGAT